MTHPKRLMGAQSWDIHISSESNLSRNGKCCESMAPLLRAGVVPQSELERASAVFQLCVLIVDVDSLAIILPDFIFSQIMGFY